MVKFVIVRTLLTFVVVNDWHLAQLDVNNVFLQEELDEEVYMVSPPSFGRKGECKQVCNLTKALYGVKQASRHWFTKLSSTIIQQGFIQSKFDYYVLTKVEKFSIIILLVYVDDILIASNNVTIVDDFKKFLDNKFKLKDLGILKYFLGLEVARNTKGISLCQRKYTIKVLSDAGFLASKPVYTPMKQFAKFSSSNSSDLSMNRRLVGKFLYLTLIKPDIGYVVHKLNQYLSSPKLPRLQAAYKVLKYLKNNPRQGLFFFSQSTLHLKSYCDVDWVGCPKTRRSIFGFCVFLGDSLIS